MKRICWETTGLGYGFRIRLVQTGVDRFRVEYGKQIDKGNYEYAARKLGEAIMHALACDGRLDNSERSSAFDN